MHWLHIRSASLFLEGEKKIRASSIASSHVSKSALPSLKSAHQVSYSRIVTGGASLGGGRRLAGGIGVPPFEKQKKT